MLVKIGANVSDVTDKLNKISKSVDANKKKIQKGLNKVSTVVAGVGLASIKMATDFNTSLSNIATLIPEKGVKRVNELKQSIQDMAIATGKATGDIADGAYQVISAFGDTADTVKMLEINVLAAAAGMSTTTDAINLTSAVTKGYGDVTKEAMQKVADLAFTTVKLGQTTFPELANSIGSVVPIAKKLNVSQEELFGTFAAFTGVTGDASKVATQFEGVLGALIKPSEDMIVAMGEAGYKTGEAMIADLGLIGAMEKLISKTDGTSIGIGKLITRKEGLTLAMAMTGAQSDVLKDKIAAMSGATGAADEAFETMTSGVGEAGFKFAQAKQQVAVFMQTLGDQLAPVIADIIAALKPLVMFLISLVKGFGKLPKPIKTVLLAIGGLVAAAAPLFKVFTSIKGLIPILGKGLGVLKGAFAFLLSPMGLVVIALAAIAYGFLKVKAAQKELEKATARYNEVNEKLFVKLGKAAEQAGMTGEEFAKLREKYKGNSAALGMAIKRGAEGIEIQKSLAKVGKEQAKTVEEQKKKMQEADPAAKALADALRGIGEEAGKAKAPLRDLTTEAEEFSIVLRSAIVLELAKAETLLANLKATGDVTGTGIADLTAKIKALKIELGLMEEIVTTDVIPSTDDLRMKLRSGLLPVVDLVPRSLKTAEEALKGAADMSDYLATHMGTTAKEVKEKCYNMVASFMALSGHAIPSLKTATDKVAPKVKQAWFDVSTVMSDISKKWADAIVDTIGVTDWFYTKAKEFDDSYYLSAIENIEKKYGKSKEAMEQELADLEEHYSAISGTLEEDYEKKKQHILDNVKDEELRQQMLADLETQHMNNLEKGRKDQQSAEEKLRNDLTGLEEQYQLELDAIRADEAKARDSHREDELEKQKSIWNKMKGALGEVIGDMLKMWLTKFIGGILDGSSGLLDGVKGIFKGIGGAISSIFGKAKDAGVDAVSKVASSAGEMGKGFLGNIAKMAGPVGIGLLAVKLIGFKNIQKTVQDVWKGVSENVIKGIKLMGKAIDAVGETAIDTFKAVGKVVQSALGAASDIISGLGKGIGGLLAGIGGLAGAATPQVEKDQLHELRLIKETVWKDVIPCLWEIVKRGDQIRDTLNGGIAQKFDGVMKRIDSVKTLLGGIRDHTRDTANALKELLKKLPAAQHGAHFARPTLALVGEVPETVIPDKILKAGGLGRRGGGETNLKAIFHINALDPRTMRDVVRNQIAPEFIEFVRVGAAKTKMKEALL